MKQVEKITEKMKSVMAILAVMAVAASFFITTGCGSKITGSTDGRSYTFTLERAGSGVVAGATITIQLGARDYSAISNDEGTANLAIPNDVSLPVNVVATADQSSVKPEALTFPGAPGSRANRTISFEPAPSRSLVKETRLHHLGNDYYGGEPNSQLQMPSEGSRWSGSFNLSSIPGSMPFLRFFGRGLQTLNNDKTKIKINGITVDYLNASALDGSLSKYQFQLTADPHTVLRQGVNTFTIESAVGEGDVDDFEFCGLLLYYN